MLRVAPTFNRTAARFAGEATDTGGGGIAGYRLYCGASSSSGVCATVDSSSTDGWITELENKRDYFFAVSAVDRAGNESAKSLEMNVPVGHTDQAWQAAALLLVLN